MLADLVERHTVAVCRSGPYAAPGDDLLTALPGLLDALVSGVDVPGAGVALGLGAVAVEGRTVLHPPTPAGPPWLLAAVPPGPLGAATPLVQVPHPYADLHTEKIALLVLDAVPDAVLLQAGAHRVAAGPRSGPERYDRDAYPADVARRPDALFSRVADGLVARCGVPQVQLHGFVDREGIDAVVSPGAAAPSALLDGVAAALAAAGLRVRDHDDPGCADLAGRRNVQGRSARDHGTAFVHLELSRSVRDDPGCRERVAAALAGALASR